MDKRLRRRTLHPVSLVSPPTTTLVVLWGAESNTSSQNTLEAVSQKS